MTIAEAQRECHGHDGYRHEAFFYDGAEAFMERIVPFVHDAITAAEPALVVLAAPKIAALREVFDDGACDVMFADMAEVGTNPARIIPAWRRFLDEHAAQAGRVRGIGEPIWAGRSAAELVECQRHEALLNVAFSDPDFWLLCPYDTGALPPEVIEEARRNHPYLSDGPASGTSAGFPGVDALSVPFAASLPDPPPGALVLEVDAAGLHAIRAAVGRHAADAGLASDRASDLVISVNELATNSVRHGGGEGTLRLWREPGAVVCEVRVRGHIADPLAGRIEPSSAFEGGRGLWMANQLCELVQIRSLPEGSAVRVHMRLPS